MSSSLPRDIPEELLYSREQLANKIDYEGGLPEFLFNYISIETLRKDYEHILGEYLLKKIEALQHLYFEVSSIMYSENLID